MANFSSSSFETFTFDELPLQQDTYLMDEIHLTEWETTWLRSIGGDKNASPYEVGYITPVHIAGINPAGADISWFANTHDRFHAVKTFFPRAAFVAAAAARAYEGRATVFVKSEWLRKLHLRSNSIFAMIDVADMTDAIKAGAVTHDKIVALRDALDALAAVHPAISFISFADSLLIKTNWTVGMVNTDVGYTYAPERLLTLFRQVRTIYADILGLGIYGVFAQGSNEYYDDPLLHISGTGNHISLNSLGLPFAQIALIEGAARKAIRSGDHDRMEVYMDSDLFHSLRFASYDRKSSWPSAPYQPKMTPDPGKYFYANCDDLLACLQPMQAEDAMIG